MTTTELETMDDDRIRSLIAAGAELLSKRDKERKEKAMRDAEQLLASVGLSLRPEAVRKAMPKTKRKVAAYHAGRIYRHPDDASLSWNGTGVRPAWVHALEKSNRRPVEIPATESKAPAK